jgi:DNA-binding Lrp family transcriptional regulator
MDWIEQRLLNDFQRNFPLVARPYAGIGARLGMSESSVISVFRELMAAGKVGRIGATFVPGRVGAATLAAIAVPSHRLQQVANMVSACIEVNHNYSREHYYNLWFVVTGPDAHHVDAVVRRIESNANCGTVLSLPMVEAYRVDLGFDMLDEHVGERCKPVPEASGETMSPATFDRSQYALAAELQAGLPLVERPYAAIGQRVGLDELAVIANLGIWLRERIINRIGVIVRHHELGFNANAMVVWDVPDAVVRRLGRALAGEDCVSLCYQRMRHSPEWNYNLFCMIHGKDRGWVLERVAEINARHGLGLYPSAQLFSRQRFKQRGARYFHSETRLAING